MNLEDKISGVYKITNTITGDFYIGSSKNIKQRWYAHRNPSFWKQHPNTKMVQAMVKYGYENFMIEVIEETTNLHEREQYWMDKLKPAYNMRRAYEPNVEEYNRKCKEFEARLCLYEGEQVKLGTLTKRFQRRRIPHPSQEARKYLINK